MCSLPGYLQPTFQALSCFQQRVKWSKTDVRWNKINMVSVQIKQNSILKIPDYNVTSPQNEEKESACSSEAHTKVTTRQSYVGCQN